MTEALEWWKLGVKGSIGPQCDPGPVTKILAQAKMRYVGLAIDELERSIFCLREDGLLCVVTYKRDLAEPTVRLLARLPNEEPPDSAAV